jgi:pimeloyl-ACP methyl ester carboxylesterase
VGFRLVLLHGLGGFKEQVYIEAWAAALVESGYVAVRFDTTNTFGESDGAYEEATVTNYSQDLEDVIAWSKTQAWYQEPFVLIGHSLGGLSSILYAQKFPREVLGLAPISTVVSGKLSIAAAKEAADVWQKSGWRIQESASRPGVTKRLPWSHMEDRLLYDVLPKAGVLTMPVLLMVGDQDTTTPVEHQELFAESLPVKTKVFYIEGAPHTFRTPGHTQETKNILLNWLRQL